MQRFFAVPQPARPSVTKTTNIDHNIDPHSPNVVVGHVWGHQKEVCMCKYKLDKKTYFKIAKSFIAKHITNM